MRYVTIFSSCYIISETHKHREVSLFSFYTRYKHTHTYTGKVSLIVSCQMENNDNFNGICMLYCLYMEKK